MKSFQLCLKRFKISSDGLYCYWRTHWLEFNQVTTNCIQAEICKSSPVKGKTSGHTFTIFFLNSDFIHLVWYIWELCRHLQMCTMGGWKRTPETLQYCYKWLWAARLLELVLRTSTKAQSALTTEPLTQTLDHLYSPIFLKGCFRQVLINFLIVPLKSKN